MADTVAAFDVRHWAQAFLHDLRDPASAAALSPSDW